LNDRAVSRILNHFAVTAKRRSPPAHAHRTAPALQSLTAVRGVAKESR